VKTKDLRRQGAGYRSAIHRFGYNRHIAWITNNGADHVDVFIESINDAKKNVPFREKSTPCLQNKRRLRRERPGSENAILCGRRPPSRDFPELNESVSVDWVGFDGVGVVEGFSDLNKARNHTEFLEAVRKIKMTPQNMVYADRAGNIAYQLIGALPTRQKVRATFLRLGKK
jgi:penicillin amidase